MSDRSKISWTDATWNPVVGCSPVSSGCSHCYAARIASRFGFGGRNGSVAFALDGKWTGEVRCLHGKIDQPLRWRRPRKVFVCSMGDLFHDAVPFEFVAAVFGVMAACPRHQFQVLTKRPERMREILSSDTFRPWDWVMEHPVDCGEWNPRHDKMTYPLPNVMIGVSVEDQATADERIPILLDTPAALRFVSAEPLIGAIEFDWCDGCLRHGLSRHGTGLPIDDDPNNGEEECGPSRLFPPLDVVIVGGESGPGARPCHVEWIRSIVKQCKAAGTKCFVKQLGVRSVFECDDLSDAQFRELDASEDGYDRSAVIPRLKDRAGRDMSEWPEDLRVREWPEHRP